MIPTVSSFISGLISPYNTALKVVILCCAANFINSADRVLMPITIISMADEYQWNLHQQGYILSAFSVGYMSSLIVGGSAAKRYGGKSILALAVLLWSTSCILTPYFAFSMYAMIFFRFVLGVGEGIGLPTIFHIFAYTVPLEERGKAFSYLIAMGSVGQTVAGLVSPHLSWPAPFVVCGIAGFLWVALWLTFTNRVSDMDPNVQESFSQQPKVTEQTPSWTEFFCYSSLWAIYAAHFSMNWSNYIIMQWLPTYLVRRLGGGKMELMLTSLPYMTNSLCGIVSGHFADGLVRRRWSVLFVRRLMTCIGLMGPGFLLFMFSASSSIPVAVVLISISMGLSACNSAGHLSSHAEVAPYHAGITFAVSNTLATIPGILCGPLTAHLVTQSSGSWFIVFVLAGCINLVGALIYLYKSSAATVLQ